MSNNLIVEKLQVVLANEYALYLKTQNYHWNVAGPHFKQLHELFEEQYQELADAVDDIAERIRALGAKVIASFAHFNQLKTISDANEQAPGTEMLKELAANRTELLQTLRALLEEAQAQCDEVTASLATDRMVVHEKARWMLESSAETRV